MVVDITEFLFNLGFNLLVALVIVRGVYYPTTRDKRYAFTFLAFNTIIYLVLVFMGRIELSLGVGFGLFAIFTMLRYRTDPIPIREMTYLFVIAALPVMNSVALSDGIHLELVIANGVVVIILLALEKEWGFCFEASKSIVYERIELIKPEYRHLLLADLQARTGLAIKRVAIGRINFLRDTADIMIFYNNSRPDHWPLVPAHDGDVDDGGQGLTAPDRRAKTT
jgi:hypothetical protein